MEEHTYIFPIFSFSKTIIGQGFIADGYFITAAHVLDVDPAAYIEYQGKTISLAKETPQIISCPPMENGIVNLNENSKADVAVFNFKGIPSPLHLSGYVPCADEEVISLCVFDNQSDGLLSEKSDKMIKDFCLSKEEGIVMPDRIGHYFGCIIHRRSTSSGSPLLIGNDVVGIMNSGHDNDICIFLSAKAIIELLKPE